VPDASGIASHRAGDARVSRRNLGVLGVASLLASAPRATCLEGQGQMVR